MSNDEQLLPAHGEHCPHCGMNLEPSGANGQLDICGGCGCIFLQGAVVSYRRCSPGDLVGTADQEQEAERG
jgi:hypothetical protein